MEILQDSRSEILNDYRVAFENKRDNPDDKNDPYFALYAQAALEELKDETVQNELVDVAEARPTDSRPYITNLLLRVIQTERLEQKDEEYPIGHNTVDSWRKLIRGSLVEHNGSYNFNMYYRSIQSNIDNRYVNPKILALMHPDRLGTGIRILDIGASQNHGLKRLALNHKYPFEDVTVLSSNYQNKLFVRREVQEDATELLNETFVRPAIALGPSRGIDIWPLRDRGNKLWVKGCSNYPREFTNTKRQERFEEFDREVNGVSFSQADCIDLSSLQAAIPEETKFNIALLSTMLYQLSDVERKTTLHNAKQFVEDDGFIMILDSVDSGPNHPNRLKFPEHFYSTGRPFGYKTLVLDMLEKQKGFQELFRWENGRCKTVIPNLGNAALSAALRS